MNRGADGGREMPMVEDVEFTSYYGRPIVKAPPWGDEISLYLFLGGLAGGSGLLGLGAQLTERPALRSSTRLVSLGAVGAGTLALVADLGRPERFLNMMRTVKITSPMSLGSWILGGFGAGAGVVAVIEVDRLTGERIPLGPLAPLRKVLHAMETPAAVASVLFAAPLASYTGVLLGATAVPTWNAAGRNGLPVVFAASACVAAGGTAMVTTPVAQAGPARLFALAGTAAELVAMKTMKDRMHPGEVEPMETGAPGDKLHRAEMLAIAGGVATAALEVGVRLLDRRAARGGGRAWSVGGARGTRSGGPGGPGWKARGGRTALRVGLQVGLQVASAAAGAALAGASAYTRFGMLEAGIESTKDPRHVVEPQRDRLEARQEAGITHDSITTIG